MSESIRGAPIAVVDDHANLAIATAKLVETFGFSVTVFHRAQEVIAAFASDPRAFRLVLTDQTMPEMTGLELALALRRKGIGVPFVVATGLDSLDTTGVTAPVEVVAKPYKGEQLEAVLNRLLEIPS